MCRAELQDAHDTNMIWCAKTHAKTPQTYRKSTLMWHEQTCECLKQNQPHKMIKIANGG